MHAADQRRRRWHVVDQCRCVFNLRLTDTQLRCNLYSGPCDPQSRPVHSVEQPQWRYMEITISEQWKQRHVIYLVQSTMPRTRPVASYGARGTPPPHEWAVPPLTGCPVSSQKASSANVYLQEIWANAHEKRDSISLISYAGCLWQSPVISTNDYSVNVRRSLKLRKFH